MLRGKNKHSFVIFVNAEQQKQEVKATIQKGKSQSFLLAKCGQTTFYTSYSRMTPYRKTVNNELPSSQ